MRLVQALRLAGAGPAQEYPLPRLALVGAGGKSSALFRLGRELASSQPAGQGPVFLTATTHLAEEQLSLADRHMTITSAGDVARLRPAQAGEVVLLTGRLGPDSRTAGLDPASLQALHALAEELQAPLLVEADGSRRRPVKAPGENEPVIPEWARQVVVLAGLSALQRPLTGDWVHRPERFAALSGLEPEAQITTGALARVLLSPEGGLKGIPREARCTALLNQADTPELQAAGASLARRLVPPFAAAIVARLESPDVQAEVMAVHEPAAGILLAAGGSSRLGQPKQLLEWRGEPFVRSIARSALAGGLAPLVVVTGAQGEAVKAAVEGLPVICVDNPGWQSGQGSSVAAGIRALPDGTGAAVFLLSDQPQISPALLRSLVELHERTLAPLVAPQADGRRANPVLFDRVTFAELQQLSGEAGGRSLFARYRPEWLPWHDAGILLDVDTPEDYQRLLDWDRS